MKVVKPRKPSFTNFYIHWECSTSKPGWTAVYMSVSYGGTCNVELRRILPSTITVLLTRWIFHTILSQPCITTIMSLLRTDNTIRSLERPHQRLGNTRGMSKMDVKKVFQFYKCYKKKRRPQKAECVDKYQWCATYVRHCSTKWFAESYCRKTCKICL